MHIEHLPAVIPLERYRAILAAMAPERETWLDEFWLRIAANVAVLAPDEPARVAERIRHIAAALQAQAKWYQDLGSPLRFTIAALLIQHHIKLKDFLGEHARLGDMLHAAGLRTSGFHHTMTVLIMLISPESIHPGMLEVERVIAVYHDMKRFHWWLTGPEDLPACAALAQCRGSAAEVVSRTEACYLLLHEAGLSQGDHLQTAANLLPLTGLDADAAVGRYRALKTRIEAQAHPLVPVDYEAIAVLSLLDHDPQVVVDRLLAVRQELDLLQPEVMGSANLIVAADLTCLDLLRFDRAMQPLQQTRGEPALRHALHMFNLATHAMLSRIDVDLPLPALGYAGAEWPL